MIPGGYQRDSQTNETEWVPAHWEQGNTSYASQEEEQAAAAKAQAYQDSLPTQASLATLRAGDVYRDTTAGNVLKVKV
jgi:hypothetical protein